ncbi:glucose PTS transporter subunit IIA [uncultured Sphingomonas sp.]|uniref:glucose PTS transporter subunit IIA n=1 Tax=uncultured Sphingomonas sp. TaxID=158754 RepID=UPI0035C96CD0
MLHAPFAGWLSTLDEVADPVFADGMMGEGLAIDPLDGLLRAPADVEVVSVPASAHAVTLRLANGAELLIHVGLDTVALAGKGFVAQVRAGDRVACGDPLLAVDLDAVGRAARDLVTPLVTPGEGVRVTIDRPGRLVAAGDPVARVKPAIVERTAAAGEAVERSIAVIAPHGLHARPSARVAALLKPYAATVELALRDRRANARSTTALLALGAGKNDLLTARAQGPDAAAALDALAAFAAERFGDPANLAPAGPMPRSAGVTAAPGLAIGRIHQFRPAPVEAPEQGQGVAHETAALAAALAAVAAAQGGHGAAGEIAEAHRALLADPELLAAAHARIAAGRSAGWGGARRWTMRLRRFGQPATIACASASPTSRMWRGRCCWRSAARRRRSRRCRPMPSWSRRTCCPRSSWRSIGRGWPGSAPPRAGRPRMSCCSPPRRAYRWWSRPARRC